MKRIAALCLALVLAGCASGGERVYGANWGGSGGFGAREYWPQPALNAGITGYVLVSCMIGNDHRLHGCQAVEETPPGWGFGAAAVRMQANVNVPPEAPTGGTTILSVPFCTSDASCAAQSAAGRAAKARFIAAHTER